MKTRILFLLLALCMLGATTSCTTNYEDELVPTYNTGDEADDPVLPTEDDKSIF